MLMCPSRLERILTKIELSQIAIDVWYYDQSTIGRDPAVDQANFLHCRTAQRLPKSLSLLIANWLEFKIDNIIVSSMPS